MPTDREAARRALAVATVAMHAARREFERCTLSRSMTCDYCNAPLAADEAFDHTRDRIRLRGCRPPDGPCFKAMMTEIADAH